MHPEILDQQNRLERLFEQAQQLQQMSDIDDETKSGFISYLCICTSGYIESSIKTILRKYVESETSDIKLPQTINFVENQLESYRLTPQRAQILELIGQFNPKWRRNLSHSINKELGSSLSSIVQHRNNIAHGAIVYLVLKDLKKNSDDAKEIVQLVYAECEPA